MVLDKPYGDAAEGGDIPRSIFMQSGRRARVQANKETVFSLLLVLGVSLRFIVMARGHNFDFESYKIVGSLVCSGKNVFANTERYNYGPLFLWIQGLCYQIGLHTSQGDWLFRVLIVSVLTWADVGIALLLKELYGMGPALVFFLSPVSIIITGFHNQFDNLAILLMLMAVYSLETYQGRKRNVRFVVLFSLSLIMKHIFAFFVFWLLFSKRLSGREKALFTLVPVSAFGLSFVLYCGTSPAAWEGVMSNVVHYRSFNNAPLLGWLYRLVGIPTGGYIVVFVALMVLMGIAFRNMKPIESALEYSMCMVAFSSAVANQYLAIPLAALAVISWQLSLAYDLFGFVYLLGNGNGLGIEAVQRAFPSVALDTTRWYAIECVILLLGIIWQLVHARRLLGGDKETYPYRGTTRS
jgi:hypothetical protein